MKTARRTPNPNKVCRYNGVGFTQVSIGERVAEICGRKFIASRDQYKEWTLIEDGREDVSLGHFRTLEALSEKIIQIL